MSEKERPPVGKIPENSKITSKPEIAPQESGKETIEFLEKPHVEESEELKNERIEKIRESLQEFPTDEAVPQSLEIEVKKPATKIEYIKAVMYEKLIDPFLKKVRGLISDFIRPNSTVVDIGCGTGALAFRLAKDKDCTVYGVDLAPGKIARANSKKSTIDSTKVQFSEADATKLTEISDQQFDYATMSLFLHSLPEDVRQQVLQEAIRVAKRIVIAEFVAKQPRNFSGLAVRGVERFSGGEHFQSFNSFRASGGLEPLLEEVGLKIVEERINSSKTIKVIVAEKK